MTSTTTPSEPNVEELPPDPMPVPSDFARIGQAIALLGASGFSLGSAIALRFAQPKTAYFTQNVAFGPGVRRAVILASVITACVFAPGAVVPVAVWRKRAVAAVSRAADLLSPLSLSAFLAALFTYKAWADKPLPFLVLLTVFGVTAEFLLTRALRAVPEGFEHRIRRRLPNERVRRWLPLGVVLAATAGYAIYFSYFTIHNHRLFGTGDFDLGININWAYNALHGHPTRCTVLMGLENKSFLANHAIFALALWLPVFALSPGAEPLLIYQSVMCAIAAIPLYLFAKEYVSRPASALIAVAYLLFAPLHGPNFYDVHELPVALPFIFLLFWCIASRRHNWVPLVALIVCAHREDMPIGVATVGLFLLLTGARPRLGAGLFVAAGTYFALLRFVIMPAAGSWIFHDMYKDLGAPEAQAGWGAVIQTLLTNPAYTISTLLKEEKYVYVLHMMAPLVFLPSRRVIFLLLAIPGVMITILTTGYGPTLRIAFQYTAHWIPYMFAATVLALHYLNKRHDIHRARGALIAMALAVVAHSTVYGAVIQRNQFVGGFHKVEFEATEAERARYEAVRAMAATIPEDASLLSSGNLLPHAAARLNVFPTNYVVEADYVFVWKDYTPQQRGVVRDLFRKVRYGVVGSHGDTIYLFKKGHSSPETEPAMRNLGVL